MSLCPRCGALLERPSECPQCGPLPGRSERLAAVLGYLLLPALVFLFSGRASRSGFVRFHCLQAILYGLLVLIATMAVWAVAVVLDPLGSGIVVFRSVAFLVELALLLVWFLAALKAYLGERYALPVVGGLARRFSV